MDRNTEDNIAKLAFGELTEGEAAQVRARAQQNPDSARALESYEALRNDLRRLRDVPPDQLSKERLQNAILAQGLKPKPIRHGFPWALVATAGAACVLATVFFLNMQPAFEPTSVSTESHPDLTAMLNQDDRVLADRLVSFDSEEPPAEPVGGKPSAPKAAVVSPVVVTTPSRPIEKSASHRRRVSQLKKQAAMYAPPVGYEMAALPPNQSEAVGQPQAKAPATLVLIQNQSDGLTGASTAVEVQQTQDVIVSS